MGVSVKTEIEMAYNEDPNDTSFNDPSYLVLHCLQRYLFLSAKIRGRAMQKRVFRHMQTAKAQIRLRMRSLIKAFTVCLQNHWILQNE